ncbi:cysteine and histidine-rich protein 1-B-like [Drosophila willistoni]|uniref:cysteine and histidine-rich protein 1-B-like n=1 Tax=Drosophila willistoni TaxID=7260 RepID=UPI001F07299A|nr:cysteine and histidine-rich protein 1-B-like [Drosophila willistoni]
MAEEQVNDDALVPEENNPHGDVTNGDAVVPEENNPHGDVTIGDAVVPDENNPYGDVAIGDAVVPDENNPYGDIPIVAIGDAVVPDVNNLYGDLTLDELRNIPVPKIMVLRENGEGLCRLEERTLDLMKCSRCKRVPMEEIFQCMNGHIICAGCFLIRTENNMVGDGVPNMVDARQFNCPTCFIFMDPNEPIRNLLAECIISQVEAVCQRCGDEVIISELREHFITSCRQSLVNCYYWRVGCKWIGALSEVDTHESICASANNSESQVTKALLEREARSNVTLEQYARLQRLLQDRFLVICNLRLMAIPEGTGLNEFITVDQIFAHGSWWVVLLMRQDEGNISRILFKLQLHTPPSNPIQVSYCLINSNCSLVNIEPNVCEDVVFEPTALDGPERVLYRNTKEATDDLLYERGLYLRMLMGLPTINVEQMI